jgi:hypothetical protein
MVSAQSIYEWLEMEGWARADDIVSLMELTCKPSTVKKMLSKNKDLFRSRISDYDGITKEWNIKD